MRLFAGNKRAGMTLLELVVGIAVFAVIAGFAAVRINSFMARTKTASAQAGIEMIALGIAMMESDTGVYPRELSDLSLSLMPGYINLPSRFWNGPYVPARLLADPWGAPYSYEIIGSGEATEETVFGPFTFSTGTPPHHHYEGTFTFAADPGGGKLVIENTPNPVTSGTVIVNSAQVAGSESFSPGKPFAEKSLTLKGSNTIEINLTGAHSRSVIITVISEADSVQDGPRGFRLWSDNAGVSITRGASDE